VLTPTHSPDEPESYPPTPRLRKPPIVPFDRLKVGGWYEAKFLELEQHPQTAIKLRKSRQLRGPSWMDNIKWHKCMVIELLPEFKVVRFVPMTRLGNYKDPPAWARGMGYSEVEGRRWIPVGNVPHYCDNMLRVPTSPWVAHGYMKINRVHEIQYGVGDDDYELRYVPDAIPRDEATMRPVFNGDHSTTIDVMTPPWAVKYYRDLSRAWSESFYTGKSPETAMLEWTQALSATTEHFKSDGIKYWMEGPGSSLLESHRLERALAGEQLVVESAEAQDAKRKAEEAAKEVRLAKQKLREEIQEKRRQKVNDMMLSQEFAAIKRLKSLAARLPSKKQEQRGKKDSSNATKQAMARLTAMRSAKRAHDRAMEARRQLRDIMSEKREEERERLKALRSYTPPPGTPQIRAWAEKPKYPKKKQRTRAKVEEAPKEQRPPASAAQAAAARAALIASLESKPPPPPVEEEEEEEYYDDDEEEEGMPRFISSKVNQHDDGW
jgi:hypothetical protein